MKISIIIPAYNEQNRIEKTMRAYHQFFSQQQDEGLLDFEFIIVVNGSTDHTLPVVERLRDILGADSIERLNLLQAGKGLAIKAGFADALTRDNDLIGFVDADMATAPEAFYSLIVQISECDSVVASRYIPGAQVFPARPAYKRWGSRFIYEPFVYLLFGLSYYDLQCGAKIFKRHVIAQVTPYLTIRQWAFDVELLYLCKKFGYKIKEVPTVWHDQQESKLTLLGGLRMFRHLLKVRFMHSPLSRFLQKK